MDIRNFYSKFRKSGMTASSAFYSAKAMVQFFENNDRARLIAEPETENYFDVYGEPDTQKEKDAIIHQIKLNGCYCVVAQIRCGECGQWKTVDSIGMCIYGNPLDPYENWYVPDLMRSAVEQLSA